MKADKSEKERQELHEKILQVEQKEDEFMLLKRQYENSLGNFATDFQYLTTQMETLLYEHVQMDELGKLSHQTRNAMEEEREKLIKERNSLPWE